MFIDLKNTFIKKCSAIVNNHLLFSAQILMTSSNAKFLTQSTGSNQPRLPRRPIRSIYTWVRFRIRLAHIPKYKNNSILKNGLAYCEIAL